jgi:hypothetical protein
VELIFSAEDKYLFIGHSCMGIKKRLRLRRFLISKAPMFRLSPSPCIMPAQPARLMNSASAGILERLSAALGTPSTVSGIPQIPFGI